MFVTIAYTLLYLLTNFCRLIGWFRWQVEGLERLPPRQAGGMVIVMNHIHWMDIPVVGTVLPLRYRLSWLAKAELFRNPLVGWFLRLMHVIPIQRGKSDAAALDAAARALRNGAVLLVFPEGHRSRTGVLQPGRGGAVRLAMQAGVPIIPCAVQGTEKGLWGTLRREPVMVQIGEPYTVEAFPGAQVPADQMEQLTANMMCRIAAMLPAAWRGPYGERNTLPSGERSATQPAPSAASTRHQT
ncbi:MAG: lysophospholipid acyltransferase family protein [Chloroflexaceae bacterium]